MALNKSVVVCGTLLPDIPLIAYFRQIKGRLCRSGHAKIIIYGYKHTNLKLHVKYIYTCIQKVLESFEGW